MNMRKFALALIFALMLAAFAAPAMARPGDRGANAPTIVETALAVNAETGEFSTLIAALAAADLVDTLNGKGQFTVFAPTDAAFAELGLNAGNVASLGTETLTDILLYHVSNGRRQANSVVNARQIRMLNGDFVNPSVSGGDAFVNSSQIIAVNIGNSNGIIHIINAVLLPPQ